MISAALRAAGVCVLLTAAIPARALDDGSQLLVGGVLTGAGATVFNVPGTSLAWTEDIPNTGKGEHAAQIRLPASTLSKLRVHVTTQNTPAGGKIHVIVRVNGADTALACAVAGTGECSKNISINVANNALVAIKAWNNFNGSGNVVTSYTLQLD